MLHLEFEFRNRRIDDFLSKGMASLRSGRRAGNWGLWSHLLWHHAM